MKDKPALKWWRPNKQLIFAAEKYESLESLSKEERIDLIKGAPFRKTGGASNVGNRSTTGRRLCNTTWQQAVNATGCQRIWTIPRTTRVA